MPWFSRRKSKIYQIYKYNALMLDEYVIEIILAKPVIKLFILYFVI